MTQELEWVAVPADYPQYTETLAWLLNYECKVDPAFLKQIAEVCCLEETTALVADIRL